MAKLAALFGQISPFMRASLDRTDNLTFDFDEWAFECNKQLGGLGAGQE